MCYEYDPFIQLAEDDCDVNDWGADWYDGEAEQLEARMNNMESASQRGRALTVPSNTAPSVGLAWCWRVRCSGRRGAASLPTSS